ncbi:hypothetical protein GGI43DRAFT_370342 [Trichoderma evansii]
MPRQSRAQGPDFDIHNDPACSGPSMEDEYRYEEDVDESVLQHYDDEEGDMSHVDGGDNSSHENEDDVFSDNSPRSSMGSVSEDAPRKNDARSPRISDIQQYETEADFVPSAKGAPRPPFRSPSSVKNLQMNSPAPSVSGGQPRSGRRSALPTVSRIGSPGSSQPPQYSPKKTPPRFKKNDPPLVLLHVTLLPLRWPWGEVLDEAKTSELSEGVKTLREAWRELQDTIGDTIQDRGVLLPHPQNDFEVMEERLLEALELPFKRRARILECGHYLGPSNEMPFADEHDSDEDDAFDEDGEMLPSNDKKPTHWCTTCSSEIPVDALGAGKIYRVKVYASNGLMRAGAWEACWKEMERVDIELEPMMDAKLQDELVHIAARQDKVIHSKSRAGRRPISSRIQDVEDEREDEDFDDHVREENDGDESFMAQDGKAHRRQTSYDTNSSGKYRQHSTRSSMGGRSSMGFAPQDESSGKQQRRFKAGSFPDMAVSAFKALLDDKRNLAILLLSALTVVVALRGGVGNRLDDVVSFQPLGTDAEVPTAVLREGGEGEGIELEGEAGTADGTSPVDDILSQINNDEENPCPAVEPQTVEKWMTATVTEMSTVAKTDMPSVDSDSSDDDDDDEETIVDKMLAGETLTLGEDYVEDEEDMHGQGYSSWFGFKW